MAKISELIDGDSIRRRREEIGASQGALAERVRKLSGKKYSQQSLAKFEKGSNSAFAIWIIQAIAELEREAGKPVPELFSDWGDTADRAGEAAVMEEMQRYWSTEELRGVVERLINQLPPEEALQLATDVMQRALAAQKK